MPMFDDLAAFEGVLAEDSDEEDDDVSSLTEPGQDDLLPEEALVRAWFDRSIDHAITQDFDPWTVGADPSGIDDWFDERLRTETHHRDLAAKIDGDPLLRQRLQSFLLLMQWAAGAEAEVADQWVSFTKAGSRDVLADIVRNWELMSGEGGRSGVVQRLAAVSKLPPPEVLPPWTAEEEERGDDVAFQRRLGSVLLVQIQDIVTQMKEMLAAFDDKWQIHKEERLEEHYRKHGPTTVDSFEDDELREDSD